MNYSDSFFLNQPHDPQFQHQYNFINQLNSSPNAQFNQLHNVNSFYFRSQPQYTSSFNYPQPNYFVEQNDFQSTRPNYFPPSPPSSPESLSSNQSNFSSMNTRFTSTDSNSSTSSSTSQSPSKIVDYATTNVYIRLLPPHTTDSSLYALCSAYGNISSVRTIFDQLLDPIEVFDELGELISSTTSITTNQEENRKCSGVGFVLFSDIHSAQRCVTALQLRGFLASFAKEAVSFKLKRLADLNSTNLYISNLPTHFNEQKLIQFLAPAEVKCVRLLRETDSLITKGQRETGPNRGIGFARLLDRESAEDTINRLQNTWVDGCINPIRIRIADSIEQKEFKAQLLSQPRSKKSNYDGAYNNSEVRSQPSPPTYSLSSSTLFSPSSSVSSLRAQSCLNSNASPSTITQYTGSYILPSKSSTDNIERLTETEKKKIQFKKKSQELKFGKPPTFNLFPQSQAECDSKVDTQVISVGDIDSMNQIMN